MLLGTNNQSDRLNGNGLTCLKSVWQRQVEDNLAKARRAKAASSATVNHSQPRTTFAQEDPTYMATETDEGDYRLSFSTGGLFIAESVELADIYKDVDDWSEVKKIAGERGVGQFQAKSSTTRTVRELVTRLSALGDDERALLVGGSYAEQSALLWLALCRTYPFIGEFAIEVLGERLASFRTDLTYDHFDAFVASKAQWNEALDELSETTLKKLRQILFRYMREAGVLTSSDRIAPYLLPQSVKAIVMRENPNELQFFPGAS